MKLVAYSNPLCVAALALGLTGCSTLSAPLDLFEKSETVLPGDRQSIRAAPATVELIGAAPTTINVTLPAARANADWPQLNGGGDRNGGHVALSAAPQVAWQSDAGSGGSGRVVAGPVVGGGRVYTQDAESQISAFDASTGAQIWRVDVTPEGESGIDGFGGGLALDGETLYVTNGFGRVMALSIATGETLWSESLGAPLRAAPVVQDGRVFAVTRENLLYAFDGEDGEPLWDIQALEQTAGILGGAAPAASGDVVVAPFSSGELGAFLAVSGRALWDDDLTSVRGGAGLAVFNDVAGDPVIADGTVYASSQSGRLVAIDVKTGERRWTRDIGGTNAPYVAGSALFFVSNEGEAIALDRETGETVWIRELAAFEDSSRKRSSIVWAGPVLAGGSALFTSNTGLLIALDPSTGDVVSETELPSGVTTAPAVAGETLYLMTDRAQLLALR